MNIALISASPKKTGSASKALLNDLKGLLIDEQLNEENIKEFILHTPNITEEEIEALCKYSVWVFSSPLYVDGIPSHLLSCLYKIEQLGIEGKNIHVYGIVNCVFFEGRQACNALNILKNWCHKVGLAWGGG